MARFSLIASGEHELSFLNHEHIVRVVKFTELRQVVIHMIDGTTYKIANDDAEDFLGELMG